MLIVIVIITHITHVIGHSSKMKQHQPSFTFILYLYQSVAIYHHQPSITSINHCQPLLNIINHYHPTIVYHYISNQWTYINKWWVCPKMMFPQVPGGFPMAMNSWTVRGYHHGHGHTTVLHSCWLTLESTVETSYHIDYSSYPIINPREPRLTIMNHQ